ncbi:MAG: hypothetical protein ACOX8F_05125 [Sakamotonia sp.]|jgi:hypothetical protein
MSYTPTAGIITAIEYQGDGAFGASGCTLLLTVQSEDQGLINILLPPGAYVLNLHPFQVGDRATFFYSTDAPAPLIFPPRYRAAAAAYTPRGVTATLDIFDRGLLNSEGTLLLNPSWSTLVTLPNGQTFMGDPGNHLILAAYSATTRSFPAQTVPEQMVVFCTPSM